MSKEITIQYEKPDIFLTALKISSILIVVICATVSVLILIGLSPQNNTQTTIQDDSYEANNLQKQTILNEDRGTHEGEIKILFFGDTAFLDPQGKRIVNEPDYNPLKPFKEMFDEADFVIGDLEATIDGSSVGTRAPGKAYAFSTPKQSVKKFKDVGIDAFSYANNHAKDYGAKSVTHTIDLLKAEGIASFGAGKNLADAHKPLYVEIRGTKFAFFGYNSIETFYAQAKANESGTAGLQEYYITENINKAKKNADVIIVFPHWGREHSTILTDTQKTWTTKFINLGVDAIVGAHPHIRQKYEVKDGVHVAYSVGNFFFPGMAAYPEAQKGMIAEIVIEDKQVTKINFYQTLMNGGGVPSLVK